MFWSSGLPDKGQNLRLLAAASVRTRSLLSILSAWSRRNCFDSPPPPSFFHQKRRKKERTKFSFGGVSVFDTFQKELVFGVFRSPHQPIDVSTAPSCVTHHQLLSHRVAQKMTTHCQAPLERLLVTESIASHEAQQIRNKIRCARHSGHQLPNSATTSFGGLLTCRRLTPHSQEQSPIYPGPRDGSQSLSQPALSL